ncbi:Lipase [Folsomia candida]|uniref:Lipase n=1 Tax=Folsomia candida TaxID=158441 RepID=A0A226DUZ3_FOLCA|nr:Lipase [Folsomia candida]
MSPTKSFSVITLFILTRALSISANLFNIPTLLVPPSDTRPTTILSIGPDLARSKKYVHLTGASYCFNISTWDCIFCKISKNYGFEFVSEFRNKSANTYGFIAVNNYEKEIIVTIRGTLNMNNVLQDSDWVMVDPNDGRTVVKIGDGETIGVNRGFVRAVGSLFPQLVTQLNVAMRNHHNYASQSRPCASLHHSLHVKRTDQSSPRFSCPEILRLFRIRGPRVGNRVYADYWNSQNMPITRVSNKADFAAYLPPSIHGYVHFGSEVWINSKEEEIICSKEVYEDPTCTNSMPVLLHNLADHLIYWDMEYLACAGQHMETTLGQFVTDL